MIPNEPIQIPLKKSSNATRSFSIDNLIQKRSYKKIKNIIENNLNIISENKQKIFNTDNERYEDRYHEAITILGERGSGKTSFLLNLESYLNNDKLCFLQILDPTLFESKQNVMLTIISIILEYVKENSSICIEKFEKDYKESLNKLADGLNLLDGIDSGVNHKSIWDDARINFNKGLDCSLDSIKFESNFNKFIKNTLQYLNRDMFILMFDDIDTNIEKGWPVLEVIRKYLTLLEMQVIVSGDWSLFCKLVRVKQLENLKGLRDIEEVCNCKEERFEYLEVLDQLEDQYLTKILKPEKRIMLQNLASIIKSEKVLIYYSKDSKPELIKDVYKNILKDTINANNDNKYNYLINMFFNLPLRSNIQLLNSYYNFKEDKDKFLLINEISKQFLTQLSAYGITLKDLNDLEENNSIHHYIMKSLEISNKYGLDFKTLLNLSTLRIGEDMSENLILFIFKSYLTAIIQEKPYLSIEWMYKIELFKHIYKKHISLENDLKYLGYHLDINPFEFTSRINGYLLYQDEGDIGLKTKIDGFASVYKDKSKMGVVSYDYFISEVNKLEDKDSYKILT